MEPPHLSIDRHSKNNLKCIDLDMMWRFRDPNCQISEPIHKMILL